MTKENFENLLKEAGFKNSSELASSLGINQEAIYNWNRRKTYPKYIETALKWAKIAKIFDKEHTNKKNSLNKEQLEQKLKALKSQNIDLKKELEFLKSIKSELERKLI